MLSRVKVNKQHITTLKREISERFHVSIPQWLKNENAFDSICQCTS